LSEYDGERAMADYIEATETADAARRDELMGRILEYNREDLAATWAVLTWLREKGRTPGPPAGQTSGGT
jgi:predicted RecB family nuclease